MMKSISLAQLPRPTSQTTRELVFVFKILDLDLELVGSFTSTNSRIIRILFQAPRSVDLEKGVDIASHFFRLMTNP